MDLQAIRDQLPALVSGHLPHNIRRFKYNVFDGQPLTSGLGYPVDPKPFEGTVVAVTDMWDVVKIGRTVNFPCSTGRL